MDSIIDVGTNYPAQIDRIKSKRMYVELLALMHGIYLWYGAGYLAPDCRSSGYEYITHRNHHPYTAAARSCVQSGHDRVLQPR